MLAENEMFLIHRLGLSQRLINLRIFNENAFVNTFRVAKYIYVRISNFNPTVIFVLHNEVW